MVKPAAQLLIAFLLVLGFAQGATAAEEIRSFHALIDVGKDGTLTVTETIEVTVEGRQILRGIYRDIPLRYEDADGRMREVGLDVLAVTRDGNTEPYAIERDSGVLRIRIGDANVLLRHGVHVYEITYETTRQIRHFEDHDELYWNVTGNGWDFPILEATAEVRLPLGAGATGITYFTGPYGSTEQAGRATRLDGGNRIRFEATRELGRREGLTVVVAFPKGIVAPPSAAELRADWWRDNREWIVGIGGLALILTYYLWAWRRVGRDPPREIVIPRWTPPKGISPALANYIEQRGFRGGGWDAFAASVIDLAVKGHLELEQPSKTLTIRRKGSGIPDGIGVGQRAILKELPEDGDSLTVDKANGETIQSIGHAFRSAIETEHRNEFYRGNTLYIAAGALASVVLLVSIIALGDFSPHAISAAFGIIVPSFLIAIVAINVGRRFRRAHSLAKRIWAVIVTAFLGYLGLNLIGGLLLLLVQAEMDPRTLAAIAGLILANLVFFFLMGAPTPVGQKRSAEIAGLRQYLMLAEKERMNMQGAPEMSPQHFETLLPYAVALGVEKPWSRAFDNWLATALATGAATYTGPVWYHGSSVSPGRLGSSLGNMASSLPKSFTASLPAPKSSSSGFSGGGFSGGGGGGGGGGGW